MNQRARSADIIPFPRRPATPPMPQPQPAAAVPRAPQAEPTVVEAGTGGEERLARALAALMQAVEEQRQAVATWREGLATLDRSVGDLGRSVHGYRAVLARTAEDVAEVGRLARATEAHLAGH